MTTTTQFVYNHELKSFHVAFFLHPEEADGPHELANKMIRLKQACVVVAMVDDTLYESKSKSIKRIPKKKK